MVYSLVTTSSFLPLVFSTIFDLCTYPSLLFPSLHSSNNFRFVSHTHRIQTLSERNPEKETLALGRQTERSRGRESEGKQYKSEREESPKTLAELVFVCWVWVRTVLWARLFCFCLWFTNWGPTSYDPFYHVHLGDHQCLLLILLFNKALKRQIVVLATQRDFGPLLTHGGWSGGDGEARSTRYRWE